MANVLEDIQECEATVVILPDRFFGNHNFEQGDWAQSKDRPTHIGGTADWAKYPTTHYQPTLANLVRMTVITERYGIGLGRNAEEKQYLNEFLNGESAIADIGDFDASTKPVPIPALPDWFFIRGEKDNQGKSKTVKTPRLKTHVDLQRLKGASGALLAGVLNEGEPVGVIERIIIKYMLDVSDGNGTPLYVPADFRADRRYGLQLGSTGLEVRNEMFITSVECELKPEGADPAALKRGIERINKVLQSRGGYRTHVRFGRLSLAEDPKAYLAPDLMALNPGRLTPTTFEILYSNMQEAGRQAFDAYGRAPDSINRQVEPAKPEILKELQRVNGRF